jgi:hypothetical protein
MKGYLAYSGTLSSYSTTSTEAPALSRARTRSMLTLIPRPVPGPFEPQPPATPKRQRKPKASHEGTDVVEYAVRPSFYRAAA